MSINGPIDVQIQRRAGGPDPALKNHKNKGFLSNTGPEPLKNHKATKPEFNVGLSSARQRSAIAMARFLWYLDPLINRINILGPRLLSTNRVKKDEKKFK